MVYQYIYIYIYILEWNESIINNVKLLLNSEDRKCCVGSNKGFFNVIYNLVWAVYIRLSVNIVDVAVCPHLQMALRKNYTMKYIKLYITGYSELAAATIMLLILNYTVNSPRKGQWRGAYFICAWTNSWVNLRDPGDLRRNRADVTLRYCHYSGNDGVLLN